VGLARLGLTLQPPLPALTPVSARLYAVRGWQVRCLLRPSCVG